MKHIRNSKLSRIVACYLAIQLILTTVQPANLYALTGGPAQPEFNSFTPIGTSDMVSLTSGDFNYNIPIMDVGGYPLNLAYDSGITTDQEASWVGLGWNLNVGQINRQLRGLPDDFNGDLMRYENNSKANITAGINVDLDFPIFGKDLVGIGAGVGIKYNNYQGVSFNTSFGLTFDITKDIGVGLTLSNSSDEGPSVSPEVNLNTRKKGKDGAVKESFSSSIGIPFDSRQGLKGINMSTSRDKKKSGKKTGRISSGYSFNDNLSFTPSNDLKFTTTSLTISLGLGTEIFGLEGPQGQVTGYGTVQTLEGSEKDKKVNAYGYINTENASTLDFVSDFNRENDRVVNQNTTMLPVVNQTFDLYSINGQGIGGMFRPHRSQVTYAKQSSVTQTSTGYTLGGTLGVGLGADFRGKFTVNPTFSTSGLWYNNAMPKLNLTDIRGSQLDYEPVYYKMAGELNVELDDQYGKEPMANVEPVRIGIDKAAFSRNTTDDLWSKKYIKNVPKEVYQGKLSKIQRTKRSIRTQSVQMIKKRDITTGNIVADGQIKINPYAKPDHIAGIKVLKPDGSTYIYGETAYNTQQIESTFAVNGSQSSEDCINGLIGYTSTEDSKGNRSGTDFYYNKVHTPAYAHTYLLSSVLSSDYEDLTNNGPTDDDLGSYTKFVYEENPIRYNWRVPYEGGKANFSEGLKAKSGDNKGNYVFGKKELRYIDYIETKTHIAIFELGYRDDALGTNDTEGGFSTSYRMKYLKAIKLYSKPEYQNAPNKRNVLPIKTAHFDYSYDLCGNTPNNSINRGKLTLKSVYFTYRGSNMGKYNPYKFNYSENNPNYSLKAYDVWGNYKPINNVCSDDEASTAEFPFVEQFIKDGSGNLVDAKPQQDQYARAWSLKSIELPSGGIINIELESDDYGYVQDKHAMQMFKVIGAGTSSSQKSEANLLYQGNTEMDYLYVQLDPKSFDDVPISNYNATFRNKYLKDIGSSDSNPMYFRFALNMSSAKYEYISGYALIDKNQSTVITSGNKFYGAIKLKKVEREGGIINSKQKVNPIAKAGWYFGRKHLNRLVYGIQADDKEKLNLVDIVKAYKSALPDVEGIFSGPNQSLRNKGCAQVFKPSKSWLRLYHPDGTKLGGGARVKSIKMGDNWDVMTSNKDNPIYKMEYGQEYDYKNEDGESSGVATFEPNGSHENPLIRPFYDNPQKLQAPKEFNYVELPIGKALYPSPSVTYSRVIVSNLKREHPTTGKELKKHATGRVIKEFYTSKDFPTISDFTKINAIPDRKGFSKMLSQLFKIKTKMSLTYSQGFVVRTNDMNGKQKSEKVQTEEQSGDDFISKVEYEYSVNEEDGTLDNNLQVIMPDGTVENKPLGVTYDMIHDFRKNATSSTVMGIDPNVGTLFIFFGLIPVPTVWPVVNLNEQELKTVTTTKVINSVGVLKKKTAYDLGSKVETENLAWDGLTGNVLLTKTINEYGDHYYNLNYPANWHYETMGNASKNLGLRGQINYISDGEFRVTWDGTNSFKPYNYFKVGDMLLINLGNGLKRAWLIDVASNGIKMIDDKGKVIGQNDSQGSFLLYKSAYKNMQSANMGSVTTQVNPIVSGSGGTLQLTSQDDWANLNVVNASAVEYNEIWPTQCEYNLPNPKGVTFDNNTDPIDPMKFNPFLYNVKGEWRATRSYTYLTSRNNTEESNPRTEGFFTSFKPYYIRSNNKWVKANQEKWTYASEVTEYSPYGVELENKDALNRYSSAQYGFQYKFPTAVTSNSKYADMGYDSFEDTDVRTYRKGHFNFKARKYGGIELSKETSHSGRKSIKIAPNRKAVIESRLIPCDSL